MVEYNEVYSDTALADDKVRMAMLTEQGRECWILCEIIPRMSPARQTGWIFYREVPDPTPDGEAIGQMVQEDVDEESSQRAQVGALKGLATKVNEKIREVNGPPYPVGDHGEPSVPGMFRGNNRSLPRFPDTIICEELSSRIKGLAEAGRIKIDDLINAMRTGKS
jgi:hypothetical protein